MSPSQRSVVVEDQLLGLSVGGYRIESLLGEGGMGLVYLARHELIDRRFAIKVLRPDAANDPSLAKNFLREAQTLSTLKHPNIIDIVGFGPLPDGRQYMVMEFLEGITLEQEMARGVLTLDRALYLADQTLSALSAAHSGRVVHRDLKPSNVFLAHGSDGVEVVKLLDFGLARQQPVPFSALHSRAAGGPVSSFVAGTPEYIAPEQAIGGAPDASSDLYAFGVMFFEMLTGRLPFDPAPTVVDRFSALLSAHANDPAPSPAGVGVQVAPGLSLLLRELLQKSPEARPASAREVRQRILWVRRQLLAEAARPQPVVEAPRPRRWGPPAAAVALLALCVSLAVALSSTFGEAAPLVEPARFGSPTSSPLPPPPLEAPLVTAVPLPVPVEPVVHAPRAAQRVRPAARRSDCHPDERWRAATRINLQELQQLAAQDPTRWAAFARLEARLSNAVGSAATGAQCEAVQQQIRKLATAWRS